MTVNRMLRVLFASALVLLLAAPVASAQSKRDKIIRDCADGSLDGNYSASEMRDARNNLPADVDEYTDCRDLLTTATHSGGPSGSGSGGDAVSGGSAAGGGTQQLSPQSPKDYKELRDAIADVGSEGVEFNGRKVYPGAAGFAANAARRDIPAPIMILLALVAAAAVAGAVPAVRKRVFARNQT